MHVSSKKCRVGFPENSVGLKGVDGERFKTYPTTERERENDRLKITGWEGIGDRSQEPIC